MHHGWKSCQRWCSPVAGQAKLLLDRAILHSACPSSSSCNTTTLSYFSLNKRESQRECLWKPTSSCSAPWLSIDSAIRRRKESPLSPSSCRTLQCDQNSDTEQCNRTWIEWGSWAAKTSFKMAAAVETKRRWDLHMEDCKVQQSARCRKAQSSLFLRMHVRFFLQDYLLFFCFSLDVYSYKVLNEKRLDHNHVLPHRRELCSQMPWLHPCSASHRSCSVQVALAWSCCDRKWIHCACANKTSTDKFLYGTAGLEKWAAIRPFATKKSRLASEKILLADSLATESCRFADRLATKLFFKADNADADRTWSRNVFGRRLCRSKMQGSWPFGPVNRVCE